MSQPASALQNSSNCFHCSGKLRVLRTAIEKIPRRLVKQRKLALFHLVEIHIAAAPGQPGNALPSIHPQSDKNSRLMRYGLPANADEPA